MNHYGQTITWSTPSAPHPFHGICTAYSYAMQLQRQLDDNEVGDYRALIQHSRKAAVSFDAKVIVGSGGSTNFLDLSAGGAVALSNSVPGSPTANSTVLVTRCVEKWQLGQAKTISLQATHFPDLIQANPTLAGVTVDVTADDQSTFVGVLLPGGKMIYGTAGLGHASGIVHGLEITQELQITEDEPDPTGVILGAASHGYLRSIRLDILAKAAAPAEGSVLAVTGTTSGMAANFQIESVEQRFADKRGKMYSIGAVWIPPLG